MGDGLLDLARKGFAATWGDQKDFEFDPDWLRYQAMETAGEMRMLAARADDELVGYACIRLHTSLVDKKIYMAVVQDIYLKPAARKGLIGAVFVSEIEKIVAHLNVDIIIIAERGNGTGALFEWLGYHSGEKVWTKRLGR